jgi:DNA ligase-1
MEGGGRGVKRFAAMYDAIDRTTSTNAKVEAMALYFREAPAADAAWAVFFLTGRRLKRLLRSRDLWSWTIERTGLALWLMEESYAVVGDFAEAMALLLDCEGLPQMASRPPVQASLWGDGEEESDEAGPRSLAVWVERLLLLPTWDRERQRTAVFRWWGELEGTERFLLNKLMTGEWRVGVSHRLVVRAVAMAAGLEEPVVAQRLAGEWWPSEAWYRDVVRAAGTDVSGGGQIGGTRSGGDTEMGRPYPFFLASPLEGAPEELGEIGEWLAEYKWDGIRAQVIRRGGRVWVWSRGDELVTDRFPEIRDAAARLPEGTALDGEVLAWRGGVLPFSVLQRRIGRLELTPSVLSSAPVAFVAFDLLERDGEDWRGKPLRERRVGLEEVLAGVSGRGGDRLVVSPRLDVRTWGDVAETRRLSREKLVEGIMLKRLESPYQIGRKRGDWWKWKIEPLAIDAVLVYAQPGHGRRANLLTDLTFAVWDAEGNAHPGELVPVAKAYSGLSNEEIAELDRWIRSHTVERFGPFRAVEPAQVFELHFEGVRESTRHRSGLAVRFPRIARWRRDKGAADADTLERVREMLRAQEGRVHRRGTATRRGGGDEEEDRHG